MESAAERSFREIVEGTGSPSIDPADFDVFREGRLQSCEHPVPPPQPSRRAQYYYPHKSRYYWKYVRPRNLNRYLVCLLATSGFSSPHSPTHSPDPKSASPCLESSSSDAPRYSGGGIPPKVGLVDELTSYSESRFEEGEEPYFTTEVRPSQQQQSPRP